MMDRSTLRMLLYLFVLAMGAPALVAQTEVVNWSTGVSYTYDGAGSVAVAGNDKFVYDDTGRLVQAEINSIRRNYTYDAYGNRTDCTQTNPSADCKFNWTINSANNRITQAEYDNGNPNGPGNVTALGPHHYGYDTLNVMTADGSTAFLYTADDERIAVYGGGSWRWTIRDGANRVLREFTSEDANGVFGRSNWTWQRDYVYRDGLLLASRQREGTAPTTYHYHLDHLGSPRRVTDQKDVTVGFYDYHAYGPEVSGGKTEPRAGTMKYTGHERDEWGDQYTLDYMHARYYNPAAGRFLSPDPGGEIARNISRPQRWNLYAYAAGNPLSFIDPDGKKDTIYIVNSLGGGALTAAQMQRLQSAVKGTRFEGRIRFTDPNAPAAKVKEQLKLADKTDIVGIIIHAGRDNPRITGASGNVVTDQDMIVAEKNKTTPKNAISGNDMARLTNAGTCMIAGCSSDQIAQTLSRSGILAFGTTNLTNSAEVVNALIETLAAYARGASPDEAAAIGSRSLTKVPDCSLYSDTQCTPKVPARVVAYEPKQ